MEPGTPLPLPSDTNPQEMALLAAYEHAASDIRNYDSVVYQIPTIGVAILYGVSYVTCSERFPPKLIVYSWALAATVLLSLTIALYKHRKLQRSRVDSLREITDLLDKLLIAKGGRMYIIPVMTREVSARWPTYYGGRFFRISAADWLQRSMGLITLVAAAPVIWRLVNFLRSLL